MTLVLTEISRFGVVMVADTAETRVVKGTSGAEYTRIKFGTPKLFPIKALHGGASFWGAGEVFVAGSDSPRMPTDIWLEDFIATAKFRNLEEFAYTLRRTISVLHGPDAPALGFQVAGVGKADLGDKLPVFYRVSNRDRKGGRTPEFEVDQVIEFPRLDLEQNVFPDGDDALYLELQKRIATGEALQSKRGDAIPYLNVRGRAEYQAAWVRLVSDLYQSAGLSRTIGGKVAILSVDYNSDLSFETV